MFWRARMFGLLKSYQKLWSLRLYERGIRSFLQGIVKQIQQVVTINPNTANFLLFQANPFSVFIGCISPRKSPRTHPRSPTMKGILAYSLLVKVARGVLSKGVLKQPFPNQMLRLRRPTELATAVPGFVDPERVAGNLPPLTNPRPKKK